METARGIIQIESGKNYYWRASRDESAHSAGAFANTRRKGGTVGVGLDPGEGCGARRDQRGSGGAMMALEGRRERPGRHDLAV